MQLCNARDSKYVALKLLQLIERRCIPAQKLPVPTRFCMKMGVWGRPKNCIRLIRYCSSSIAAEAGLATDESPRPAISVQRCCKGLAERPTPFVDKWGINNVENKRVVYLIVRESARAESIKFTSPVVVNHAATLALPLANCANYGVIQR